MNPTEDDIDTSTMRAPRDVIRMIDVLAALDGKSVSSFNNTDLREWVTKRYRARIAREGKTQDLGGEG